MKEREELLKKANQNILKEREDFRKDSLKELEDAPREIYDEWGKDIDKDVKQEKISKERISKIYLSWDVIPKDLINRNDAEKKLLEDSHEGNTGSSSNIGGPPAPYMGGGASSLDDGMGTMHKLLERNSALEEKYRDRVTDIFKDQHSREEIITRIQEFAENASQQMSYLTNMNLLHQEGTKNLIEYFLGRRVEGNEVRYYYDFNILKKSKIGRAHV